MIDRATDAGMGTFIDPTGRERPRVLSQTSLGPVPGARWGRPSTWYGRNEKDVYVTMWLSIDTCGACFGPMELVPFGPDHGSLSGTLRCRARVEPIVYQFWNECRPGGRGFYSDPKAVEQERLPW